MIDYTKLYAPTTIREIKAKYGFSLSKSLGQNFLIDKNIIDKIIDGVGITENDLVIEIGPGIGVITREAALKAKKVIAVELDSRLLEILDETLKEFDNVDVINENILDVDLNGIIEQQRGIIDFASIKIIGNLPYYITTPIIMKLLEDRVNVDSITVMMQKEVADRIRATEKDKDRGAISVAVQYYCDVIKVADVKRDVFVPPPKVDSQVLRLDVKKKNEIYVADEELMFRVIKAGFLQRRKTLLNSLSAGLSIEKGEVENILQACGIDVTRRAQTLSLEEFAKIANEIGQRI